MLKRVFVLSEEERMHRELVRTRGKGAKRAIIAIARNLIIRIRSMVLNNEPITSVP